ncbi:hypothetical protein ACFY89_08525 [Achromobacter spanius]|uniref:hypothetical protein n=1 Tax=Achromobacter spanius TaxID=217203 RepID=UPI0036ECCD46
MSTEGASSVPKWQSMIWLGLGVALTALLMSILLLVALTQMRVLSVIQDGGADPAFVASTLGSSNLILLRIIVVLIGGGISFAGLAVSFFSHESATVVSVGEAPAVSVPKVSLVSRSPGTIAVFVGAVVIVCALFARTTAHYKGPTTTEVGEETDRAAEQNLKQPPP